MISAANIPFIQSNRRSIAVATIAVIVGASIAVAALWKDIWIYPALALGATALIISFLLKPQIWIYAVVLSLYFFFNTNQDDAGASGLGGQEIAFGLFYHVSLFAWLCWRIFVKRKKLVRSNADRWFLLFMAILPLNFFIAYFNDVEPAIWIRGWQYYLLFFYYFPIREYFSDERELRRLLIVWGALTLYAGIGYFYEYKTRASNFKWANQIYYVGIRRAGFLFSAIAIFCLSGALLDRGKLKKTLWTVFFLFAMALVILSVARTAWISFTISVIVLAIILPQRKRIRLVAYTFVVGAAAGLAIMIFMPRIANLAATIITLRFSSSSNINSDPSYLSRTMENEVLLDGIADYPFGGQGLQKEHKRYDLVDMTHYVTIYGHNGYLTFAYLMGIPLAALFYGLTSYYAYASLRRARTASDVVAQLLYSGIGCGIINALVINIMGAVFNQREGLFATAFYFGLFSVAEAIETRKKNLNQYASEDVPTKLSPVV